MGRVANEKTAMCETQLGVSQMKEPIIRESQGCNTKIQLLRSRPRVLIVRRFAARFSSGLKQEVLKKVPASTSKETYLTLIVLGDG